MSHKFPSTDTVKISNIQLTNILSRHGTYSVEISNGKETKRSQKKRIDGNCIVWPESLSFTGDFADQSPWYFRIVKTRLGFTKTDVGSHEEKLVDLLQSQKDGGSCKLTIFKECQLIFTIERRGDALPNLVNEVDNALAGTSTSERPAEAANLVMEAHDIFVAQEDPWMSFLPHFETFMSVVDTIAEVHPYVQLAWSILSVIPKTIISQNERDDSINKLSQRLKEIYEYITDAKRVPTLKETQRKTLSVLIQQTIECAYFLQEYAASNNASKILKGVNIDGKVNDFNEKFDHILRVMTNSIGLETNIVTLRISNDIGELREKVEESKDLNLLGEMPRAQNAGFLSAKACLPGTRQGLITEILDWVNTSDGGSERLFLLLGQAGTGKSAVAHTISQIFNKQNRLGSLFCFSQSYKECRNLLFSTISRELADGDVQWRKTLVRIIEKTSIRTSLDIITQFDELIVKPSEVVNTIGPVVIVIDGLDESGDRAERAVLLDLLFKRCVELPSNYRLVITSRPEPDIERRCEHPAVFCKRMADIDLVETTDDIQKYVSSRLSVVKDTLDEELNIDWRLLLAKRAEGLFQWANIACNVINPTVDFGVAGRVKTFISGSTSTLYQMYHQIFLSRPEFKQEGYLPAFKTIMGALLIMRKPLSIKDLQSLFQHDFHYSIKSMMAPFHSLFRGTHDLCTPVRPIHTSLTDFLTAWSIEVISDTKERKTISNEFYVDTSDQGYFTLACLKLMNSGIEGGGLRFNICNLETSHILNEDVPDLDDRIQREISSHLSYASYFWVVHLQRSNVSDDLLFQLHHLMRTNILYLFETLGLLEKSVEWVCISMKILTDWCKEVDNDLASQAEDACQFGYVSGDAIVASTPHLYLSALPFTPNDSFIRNQYLDLFPHHVNAELGQSIKSLCSSNVIKRHPTLFLSPTAVVFSPQGRYIATGFPNGDFWLWDYKTGAIVNQWGTDEWEPMICTIVFSPNGESVTSCFLNGSFKTLNIQKNELVSHSYGVFKNLCSYSTLSNDEHYLVFHSYHGDISLYNIALHSTVQLGFLGTKSIFSPNGELLASLVWIHAFHYKAVSLWSIHKQEVIGLLCPGAGLNEIIDMGFSPDGNHMALNCSVVIQIWDMLTVSKVHEQEVYPPGGLASFLGNQNLFLSTPFGNNIIDISSGKLVRSFPFQEVQFLASIAISPDCKHVALVTTLGVIQVQEYESMSDNINDGVRYTKATFSPLNTYLILEGFNHNFSCKYLQILKTATITEVIAQTQLEDFIVGISPNDDYIAYAATQGLCLWSDKGGELVLDTAAHELTALAFSFTGNHLISGDKSGTIMVWNIHTYQLDYPPYKVMPLETQITALAFSSTGTQFLIVYLSGFNHMVEIHDSQLGKISRGPFTCHFLKDIRPSPNECFVAFSANETYIVYIPHGIGSIIDTRTGQTLQTFRTYEESGYLNHEISSNRKYILWKDEEQVKVWNIDAGEAVHGKWLNCLSTVVVFSNDSEQIVTIDRSGEINFWDISTGNKSTMPTFCWKSLSISKELSMLISNKKYLVTVCDYSLDVWSLETHQHVSQYLSNNQELHTSLITHSEVKLFDGAVHDQILSRQDQERTEYALVAWKKALFSESSQIDTFSGWVQGPSRELLFWVPREQREGLWRPKMMHLLPACGTPVTKLTFDNFVHGSMWTKCKENL